MATVERYLLPDDGRRSDRERTRYRVRYRTPDRRQTDKRGFLTKRAAEEFAATVEVSKLRGEFIEPAAARVDLGALGVAWLGRQTHLKPSSLRPLQIAWRVHVEPRWGTTPVSDVRFSEVQQWVVDLAEVRGATTVIRAFGVLAAILDDAVRDRRLLTNPARGVDLPRKVRAEHVYLTHQQVHDLAAESGQYGTLVLLLAYCGLRWGEASALRVSDVNPLRRRVSVAQNAVEVGSKVHVGTPKNHKRRTVPVPAFLEEQLVAQGAGKAAGDLLFPGPAGGHLRPPTTTGGWLDRAVVRARVPRVTAHGLRHTAASLAVSAGANVKAVQRMLGHASAAMTLDVYADLFDDDLEAVASALDEAVSRSVVPVNHKNGPPSVGGMWAPGGPS